MHEGNYFTFDGVDSQIYGARLCQVGESSYTYSGGSNIELITDKATRSHKNTLLGIRPIELSFDLTIYFEYPLTLYDVNEVKTWLFGHSEYKKLYIQNPDYANIYYNCILNDPEDIVYNGFNAIKFNVVCDSGGAWRDETVTTVKFTENEKNNMEASFNIVNNSAINDFVYPLVEISVSYPELINGINAPKWFSICNTTDATDRSCTFSDLKTDEYGEPLDITDEYIVINNDSGYIESRDSEKIATYIAKQTTWEPFDKDCCWYSPLHHLLRKWDNDTSQWSFVNVKVGDTVLLVNRSNLLTRCVVSETSDPMSIAGLKRIPKLYVIPNLPNENETDRNARISELVSSEYFQKYDYYIISDNPNILYTAGTSDFSQPAKTLFSEEVSDISKLCYKSFDNGILYFTQYNSDDNYWYDYCITNKTPIGKENLFWVSPDGSIKQFTSGSGWDSSLKRFDTTTNSWVDANSGDTIITPDTLTKGFFSSVENVMFTRDNAYNWNKSSEYVGAINATVIDSINKAVRGFYLLLSDNKSQLIYRETEDDEWMVYPFISENNNSFNLFVRDKNTFDYYSYDLTSNTWQLTPVPENMHIYYFINYWGINQKMYKRNQLQLTPENLRNRFPKFNKTYIRLKRGINRFVVRGLVPDYIKFTYSEFVRIGG